MSASKEQVKPYIADLHIHTVLSPCGDVYMSPSKIVEQARQKGVVILGITDHNSTKNCQAVSNIAKKNGIFTLCGAEVTTREEVHCLTFFEDFDVLKDFQELLDKHIYRIAHDSDKFGEQVVVNEEELITEEVDHLLINATDLSIEQLAMEVYARKGIFIPAHINRPYNSLLSQLGIVPDDLPYDALEIHRNTDLDELLKLHPYLKEKTFIKSSDAHFPAQTGNCTSTFFLHKCSFHEIKLALHKKKGRYVLLNTSK